MHVTYVKVLLAQHPAVPDEVLDMSQSYLDGRGKPAARRKWLSRWQQRWGFNYKKLPCREWMLPEKFSQKVGSRRVTLLDVSKRARNGSRVGPK
jgi:hypothetical protein